MHDRRSATIRRIMPAEHLSRSYCFVTCLVISIAVACATPAPAQESDGIRRWTDASGKFEVQASLVQGDAESIELQTTDGQRLTIKISQLSAADQEYLKQNQAGSPDSTPPTLGNLRIEGKPVRIMAFHTGRKLELDVSESWNLTPDPAPVWNLGLTEFKFPETHIHSHPSVIQARFSPHAIYVVTKGAKLHGQKLDLSRGDVSVGPSFQLPKVAPFCLSPGGKRLLMVEDGIWSASKLGVFDLVEDSAKLRTSWRAFDESSEHDTPTRESFGLKSAMFASDQYLVTVHRGLCALWDVEVGQLCWWTYTDYPMNAMESHFGFSGVTLSPGGHQLFFQSGGFLVGVSVPDGRVIAKQKMELLPASELSISPDGKNLILISQFLRVVSLESGEREVDIGIGRLEGASFSELQPSRVSWINSRMFMLDSGTKSSLMDLNRRAEVRTYGLKRLGFTPPLFMVDGNGSVAYVANDTVIKESKTTAGLFRLDLSKEIALSESRQAPRYDLQPGDSLGLHLQLIENQFGGRQIDRSQEFRPVIEQLLADRGFEVRENNSKHLQIHWTLTTESVDMTEKVYKSDSPKPASANPFDKMAPFSRNPREVTPLEARPDFQFPKTEVLTIATNFQSSNCGLVIDGQLAFSIGLFSTNRPVQLSGIDQLALKVRDLEIPEFVSVYRGDVTKLDFVNQSEQTNSNSPTLPFGAQPIKPRLP